MVAAPQGLVRGFDPSGPPGGGNDRVLRRTPVEPFHTILFAADFSEDSTAAFRVASSLANVKT